LSVHPTRNDRKVYSSSYCRQRSRQAAHTTAEQTCHVDSFNYIHLTTLQTMHYTMRCTAAPTLQKRIRSTITQPEWEGLTAKPLTTPQGKATRHSNPCCSCSRAASPRTTGSLDVVGQRCAWTCTSWERTQTHTHRHTHRDRDTAPYPRTHNTPLKTPPTFNPPMSMLVSEQVCRRTLLELDSHYPLKHVGPWRQEPQPSLVTKEGHCNSAGKSLPVAPSVEQWLYE
jgi:hypothetical protein